MKHLAQYQNDFKVAAVVLVRLTHNSHYEQVARPILRLSHALKSATTFEMVEYNYIQLLEKLSYLKGALQNDPKIIKHLHLTINLLKSLVKVAKDELTDNKPKTFILVKAVQTDQGLQLKAFATNEYQKPRGSILIHVDGTASQVQHLPDDDWSLTDFPVI